MKKSLSCERWPVWGYVGVESAQSSYLLSLGGAVKGTCDYKLLERLRSYKNFLVTVILCEWLLMLLAGIEREESWLCVSFAVLSTLNDQCCLRAKLS